MREFRGHGSFVNSVAVMGDGETVVTGSSDGSVRLWDPRSLECLVELRPPQPSAATDTPVLAAVPLHGAVAAAAAAAQASMSKRSVAAAAAALTTSSGGGAAAGAGGLRASLRSQEALLVVSRGPAAHILASGGPAAGSVLCTLRHERLAPRAAAPASAAAAAAAAAAPAPLADVVACAVGPQGRLVYLLLADRALLAYGAAGWPHAAASTAQPCAVIERATEGEPLGLALHPLRNLLATWAADGVVRLWKP